uniref:CUB domain-containing protein n=1 Tax=Ascaris lumbricoides TaxID=6252 RepID=A0A0M3IC17_ASCLU
MPMGNNAMELGRGQVVHSTKWKENETRTCFTLNLHTTAFSLCAQQCVLVLCSHGSFAMWSYFLLTILLHLALAVGCTYQKSERVVVEIKAGKTRSNSLEGSMQCSTPVRFDVRNDSKTFILMDSTNGEDGTGARPQCIETLRNLFGKRTFEIHYGRQISSEVIVEHCNLSDFNTYSAKKPDRKGYFMTLNFRCEEKDRSIELRFLEYLFVLIFACAALGTFMTIAMHFCCGNDKKSQTVGARSTTASQKPDPEGTDSSGPNNSSTPSYE